MRKAILAATMAALTIPATMTVSVPAQARDHHHERHYYKTDNGIRYWRGNDGHYYCHKSDGTTGLLIGGVAGALVGRSLDSGGDHATGTILGAAAGALIGRQVDRNNSRPHCR